MTAYFAGAETNKCTTEETSGDQKRLCFFALNGPEESERVKQNAKCIQVENGSTAECGDSEQNQDAENALEIKEFYADSKDSRSVSQAFEEMTKTRCDGLVISGYHAGYYTGNRTSQKRDAQGNRDPDSAVLNLKFLEKLSCLQGKGSGSDCRKWFDNIKYVHLHGSHTSGHQVLQTEGKSSVDDLALDRMKKYAPESWTRASAQYLNREYASTVDENNSLSGRYLKMFPSAQIYSWGAAPTIDQGSPETFIEHLKAVTAHADIAVNQLNEGPTAMDPSALEKILNILSSTELEPKCVQLTTWDFEGKEINSISAGGREREDKKRQAGCDFSSAVESKDGINIITALDNVLKAGALHENLNRIFYALNDDSPLSSDVKNTIKDKLKNHNSFQTALKAQALSKEIGVVKRADALYLYKEIYPEEYKKGDLEAQWVGDLVSLYERQKESRVGKAVKEMIAEIVWRNHLGSAEKSKAGIQKLLNKLKGESDLKIRQHTELMKVSSGMASDETQVKEIFNKLFEEDKSKNQARESWFFVKVWSHLRMKNGKDIEPIQELYDSHLEAYSNEADSRQKKELNKKLTDIIAGISDSFAVKKEECLKEEFPLSDTDFKATDSDRNWMKQVWMSACSQR